MVLIISLTAYLYRLEDFPRYFIHDEIDYGFLAKKIMETGEGKVEGLRYPLFFESWGGVKYPIQVYTTLVSYWVFGISVFSTRLPSVVFGAIRNIFFYKIMAHMLGHRTLAVFSTILFIFYPWNFFYSRIAFEHTSFLMLIVISFYYLQLFIQEREGSTRYKILSGFFLGLALYAYTLAKVFIPLYLAAVILLIGDGFGKRLKHLLPYLVAVGVVTIPYWFRTSSDRAYSDYAARILLFNYIDDRFDLALAFLKHYLYTYSGLVRLVEYSEPRPGGQLAHYTLVGVPLVPYIYLPLILWGLLHSIGKILRQEKTRTYLIYIFGFLTFPVVSMVTVHPYISHRLILGAFFTFVMVAIGMECLFRAMDRINLPWRRILSMGLIAVLSVQAVYSTVTAFKNDDVLLLSHFPEANKSPSFAHHYVNLHKAIDEVFRYDFDHLYISEDLFPVYSLEPVFKELLWLYSFRSPLTQNRSFGEQAYGQKVIIFSNKKPLDVDIRSLVISEREISDPRPKHIREFFETRGGKKYNQVYIYKRDLPGAELSWQLRGHELL